jgi:hypothetical protein
VITYRPALDKHVTNKWRVVGAIEGLKQEVKRNLNFVTLYPGLHAFLTKCDLFHTRNSLRPLRQIFARDRHASFRFSQNIFFYSRHI